MRKAGFLRSPRPAWALQVQGGSEQARGMAARAVKLFEIRRLIWKIDLALVVALVTVHLTVKFLAPGFPAAEYLATEIGVLEAATLLITRRIMKKEKDLEEAYLQRMEVDGSRK